ncbi:hypothetical protein JD844_000147 [Phrynosoma platyrhinos]|uniref:Core-binding factor subunit beta n=1 Tax=Phrynosoma platyrhinos TaxID=52577 RepID=A0ABQ7SQA7_PHRPL|nr:hypothetical protein JD844_000147 [Phrynosoma platyrhinos]
MKRDKPGFRMLVGTDGLRLVLPAFVATGTNLSLQFFPASWQGEQRQTPTREYVDFEREGGKVYLKAPMILNGVCVIWKGWIDLQRLDGMGCLEFDEERAQQEDALAQQAFEEARRRTREFEDRDRSHREEMEVRVSQLLSVTVIPQEDKTLVLDQTWEVVMISNYVKRIGSCAMDVLF